MTPRAAKSPTERHVPMAIAPAVLVRRARLGLIVVALAAVPALAADVGVVQSNQTFSIPTLSVHAGDLVRFDNHDTVTHNITIKAGGDDDAEDLGLQKPGATVSYRFAAKGAYKVICSIHPRMKMTVNVQ